MEFTPFHAALLVLLIFINRPIAILLHELAHGVSALILSGEKVGIYVGSYGDRSECYHLKFGLLEIWLKKQFSLWDKGLCVPEHKKISVNKQIFYIFMGPFMTLLIAIGLGICVFLPNLSFPFRLTFLVMSLSNFLAAKRSFVPNPQPISTAYDVITYNDGQNLRNLFKYRRLESHYKEAADAYNSRDFDRAGDLFRAALKTEPRNPDLFRYTISAYSQAKNYALAAEIYLQFEQTGAMNAKDFNDAGLNYAYMRAYEQGLACFDKALALEPDQPFARHNQAFSFLMLGRYEEAVALFDELFNKEPENAYLIANRGLAKSKLGQSEAALSDMERAQKIDPDESYVYRSLGIYYLDRGDHATALTHFKKAQELNPETHLIGQLIEAAA